MTEIRVGSEVRYDGDLPAGCAPTGDVIAIILDASGDSIATVRFHGGIVQDVPVSELVSADSTFAWLDELDRQRSEDLGWADQGMAYGDGTDAG